MSKHIAIITGRSEKPKQEKDVKYQEAEMLISSFAGPEDRMLQIIINGLDYIPPPIDHIQLTKEQVQRLIDALNKFMNE